MKKRETLFDSRAEKRLFRSLDGFWEPEYRLWIHIPFANLVELHEGDCSAVELNFLHQTTVDFVLASSDGQPVLALEFDGLGGGYSRAGVYRPGAAASEHPSRIWKLGLKARVSSLAHFPFMIVSNEEADPLAENHQLSLVHGLVGSALAQRELPQRLSELLELYAEDLRRSRGDDHQDLAQDIMIQAEVDTGMRHNPVLRASAELEQHIRTRLGPLSVTYEPLEEGPRPPGCSPWREDFEVSAFQRWWTGRERLGVKCSVSAQDFAISRSIWVRNLEGCGYGVHGWLDELAMLVTASAALRALESA